MPTHYQDANPSPFTTIVPKDEHRKKFKTMYGGLFTEVFEKREFETYGHFTFNTTTNKITKTDTTALTGFLIDPVAFAYDFGARMYDARLGIFTSIDPKASKYPSMSPYVGMADNPIIYVDEDGKENVIYLVVANDKSDKPSLDKTTANKIAYEANKIYEKLGVATRVVVYDEKKNGVFKVNNLEKTDGVAVVGTNRKSILQLTRDQISKERAVDLERKDKNGNSWVGNNNGNPENSACGLPGQLNIGIAVDFDDNWKNKFDPNLEISAIDAAAIAIVHGSSHNAGITHHDKDGTELTGIMDEGGGLREANSNYENNGKCYDESVLNRKQNTSFIQKIKQRFGNKTSQDNYSKGDKGVYK